MLRRILVIFPIALQILYASATATEYWELLGGPQGGDVRCLFSPPSAPATVYLGIGPHGANGSNPDGSSAYGSGGALFASSDGGRTWNRSALQNIPVAGVAETEGLIEVATFGAGVFSTTDPPGSFTASNAGLANLNTRCISGADVGLVVGTTTGPFYRNGGADYWAPGDIGGDRDVWALARAPWDSDLLLAGTDSSIFRSIDAGVTWEPSGMGIDQVQIRSLAFGDGGEAWAGSFDRWNGTAKLYASADSGQTWSEAFVPSLGFEGIWAILPDAGGPDQIMIGTGSLGSGQARVYASPDGGSQWETALDVQYGHIRALLALPEENAILAGCGVNGGVFITTDTGESWEWAVQGLDAGNTYAIDVLSEEDGTIIAGLGFHGSIALGYQWGTDWRDLHPQFPSLYVRDLLVSSAEPGRVLAAAWNNVYLSTDYGETWQSEQLWSTNVAVESSPADPQIIYVGGWHGLFVTTDNAETWAGPDSVVGNGVTAVAVDPFDGWHAFVAAGVVLETEDAGASWDTLAWLSVRSLVIHPIEPIFIYAGTDDGGVYVSQDGGQTFEQRISGLGTVGVNAIIPDPEDPARVWAGTQTGVYKTQDLGLHWVPDNIGLENLDVHALMVHNPTRRIYVGTYAGGVRASDIGTVGTDNPRDPQPMPSALAFTVSPSPCDELLTIFPRNWPKNQPDRLLVRLTDIAGREIMSERILTSGWTRWNMSHVPPGTYFLVAAEGSKFTAPVVVVR